MKEMPLIWCVQIQVVPQEGGRVELVLGGATPILEESVGGQFAELHQTPCLDRRHAAFEHHA
jgi:hypothetical protein